MPVWRFLRYGTPGGWMKDQTPPERPLRERDVQCRLAAAASWGAAYIPIAHETVLKDCFRLIDRKAGAAR